MNDPRGYAVFFFANALEALGDAIKPYLHDGPAGPHLRCHEVDTGGAFVELTLRGRQADGRDSALELMVPSGMVRMIASVHGEAVFGFGPRGFDAPAPELPAIGPGAPPAAAPAAAVPATAGDDAGGQVDPAPPGDAAAKPGA